MTFACAALLVGLSIPPALAEAQAPNPGSNTAANVKTIRQRFLEVAADKNKRAQALAAGRQASAPCTGCHGVDGNSSNPEAPNLASQNPVYLLIQFHKLDVGLRQHDIMEVFVKQMTADDRFNIALYFSSQPVNPPAAIPRPAATLGNVIYKTQFCNYCHGEKALGSEYIPRLAGQQRSYLVTSISHYRARNGVRNDPMMSTVVEGLSDEEIAGIADYLSGLHVE